MHGTEQSTQSCKVYVALVTSVFSVSLCHERTVSVALKIKCSAKFHRDECKILKENNFFNISLNTQGKYWNDAVNFRIKISNHTACKKYCSLYYLKYYLKSL